MASIAGFRFRSGPFAIALPLVIASLGWSCSVLNARAENGSPSGPALAGRWVDKTSPDKLVFDISSCGEGWCGVKVAEGTCGDTVLRVKQAEKTPKWDRHDFTGKLELTRGAQPYFVKIRVWRTAETDRLEIIGDTRSDFLHLRRWYPFVAHMVRRGDAQCRVDAKTS